MAARLLIRIVRKFGLRAVASLALLLAGLGSVALELASTVRELDAGLLLPVTIAGMLIGWGLARLPLRGWPAGMIAAALGVGAIFFRVGRLGGSLVVLLHTLPKLIWRVGRWPLDGPPDRTPVLLGLTKLWLEVSTLLIRLRDWSLALIAGEPTFDPVAAALVWSLALWMVAAWAGWAVRRGDRSLCALAPAGALLATSLSYVGGRPFALLPLLGTTLLLMALLRHAARERRWEATGVDFSPEIRLDIALVVIPLSLTLLVVAALAPSISVRQLIEFTRRLSGARSNQVNPVASSLGLYPQSGQESLFDAVRTPGLPRRHLIGSGPDLSQRVVMTVRLDAPSTASSASMSGQPPRYYWRSLTYDRYTGRGWVTGPTKTVAYRAGAPAGASELAPSAAVALPGYQMVRQEVRAVGDLGGLLHVAGELFTADQDYRVAWRPPADAFGASIEATGYRADSLVPAVSETQLRAATGGYPRWVRDRYLALPEEVPARVLSLARDLTATAPTLYDRARAIETYLRAFPYTLDLPPPPPDRDVVDYFLFELKQGYCDYYATAMVVLARAAGLPARLVVGYFSGTYDVDNARYVVTEADAHSWVEVYFPGYGWVEFEPTAGRPLLERPTEAIPIMPAELEALQPMISEGTGLNRLRGPLRLYWPVLPGGFALLALGSVVWWLADGWRLRRLPPTAAVAVLYQRLYDHGRRLSVPVRAGDTPYEFAASLAGWVADLAREGRWSSVLAPAAQEVTWLTDLYVRVRYGMHRPDASDQVRAVRTWQRLRRRLWLAWVWHKGSKRGSWTGAGPMPELLRQRRLLKEATGFDEDG